MTIGLIANNDGSGAVQLGGINAISIDTSLNSTMAGYVNAPNTFGFKNRIINGGMVIDQRNAGASVTPINGQYLVDRFFAGLTQASKFTAQQSSTAPVGFSKSLLITSSSAYNVQTTDIFYISQAIEGLNVSDLAWGTASAVSVTLSFRVYSSLTGTFGGSIVNSGASRSYPFTYSIASANTWTTISVTIPGDTSGTWLTTNDVGMYVFFGLGTGATYSGTAGAWAGAAYYSATGATSVVGTSGATFYITGVQLEKGSVATPFDFRDYGCELIMCQRYWQSFINTAGLQYGPFAEVYTGNGAAGGVERNVTSLPVTMRDVLTISRVGTWSVSNCGQPTLTTLGLSSFRTSITVTAAGAAAASPGAGTGWTANAEL